MTDGIRVLAPPPPGAEAILSREALAFVELARLGGPATGRLREASEILDGLVGAEKFVEFLTLPAYRILE